jgi:hypothetical protein
VSSLTPFLCLSCFDWFCTANGVLHAGETGGSSVATQVGCLESATQVGDVSVSDRSIDIPLVTASTSSSPLDCCFDGFDRLDKPSLVRLVSEHGLVHAPRVTRDHLRDVLMDHFCKGSCADSSAPACVVVAARYSDADQCGTEDLQAAILDSVVDRIKKRPLHRLLALRGVTFDPAASLRRLRQRLRSHISELRKGKRSGCLLVGNSWPQLVPSALKERLVRLFREATSSDRLAEYTCACCAESCLVSDRRIVPASSINLELLRCSGDLFDSECISPTLPYTEGLLGGVLVDKGGVSVGSDGRYDLSLCRICFQSLRKNKVPPLSLANLTFLGAVPDELRDLTPVEESMIARCRAKCWIVQLTEQNRDLSLPNTQRGMKGHIIIYPQQPDKLLTVLPPSVEDVITPICVLFVGSSPPSQQWLKEHAKPLAVRREKVRSALVWLKQHNPHYKDVVIDHSMLDALESEQILPFHIERVLRNDGQDMLTSTYDPSTSVEADLSAPSILPDSPFQSVVITDVDGHAPANELRAAAVRHMKRRGGYVEIPHGPQPVNEFCNPQLFPMIYPTLFPYGIGGFEDSRRRSALSLKRHVKHLFNLADRRFQQHFSFLFTTFNILQRRAILLRTSLKVRKSSFDSISGSLANVSFDAVH